MSEPLNDAADTIERAKDGLADLKAYLEASFARMRRRHKRELISGMTAAWWIGLAIGYAIGKYL